MESKFLVGAPCFAKVRGWAPFPAKVLGRVLGLKKEKYSVSFYGTGETGEIEVGNIWGATPTTVSKFVTESNLKKKNFRLSFELMVRDHNFDLDINSSKEYETFRSSPVNEKLQLAKSKIQLGIVEEQLAAVLSKKEEVKKKQSLAYKNVDDDYPLTTMRRESIREESATREEELSDLRDLIQEAGNVFLIKEKEMIEPESLRGKLSDCYVKIRNLARETAVRSDPSFRFIDGFEKTSHEERILEEEVGTDTNEPANAGEDEEFDFSFRNLKVSTMDDSSAFTCEECGKIFEVKKDIVNHIMDHALTRERMARCVRNGGGTLLGKAVDLLDRNPGNTVDVGVDLCRMFEMKEGGDSSSIVPRSLSSTEVEREKEEEVLKSLVFSTEKECLNLLHTNLGEAFSKKKAETSGENLVTGYVSETGLKDNTGDHDALLGSLGSVNTAQCAITCMDQDTSHAPDRRKSLQALMGQFSRIISEEGERVLGDLTDLVRGTMDNSLELDDMLLLLVLIYNSIDVGVAFQKEEEILRSVLREALLKEGKEGGMGPVIAELCRREVEDEINELAALGVVNKVWKRLEDMKSSRAGLRTYQSLINCDGEICVLVEQLLRDVYHPAEERILEDEVYEPANEREDEEFDFSFRNQQISTMDAISAFTCEECGKVFEVKKDIFNHIIDHALARKMMESGSLEKVDSVEPENIFIDSVTTTEKDLNEEVIKTRKQERSKRINGKKLKVGKGRKGRTLREDEERVDDTFSEKIDIKGEIFHCKDCPTFVTSVRLKARSHALYCGTVKARGRPLKKLVCNECTLEFKGSKALKSHFTKEHKSACLKYTCSTCLKEFSGKRTYMNHLILHQGNSVFKCQFCHKSFNFKSYLRRHVKRVHSNPLRELTVDVDSNHGEVETVLNVEYLEERAGDNISWQLDVTVLDSEKGRQQNFQSFFSTLGLTCVQDFNAWMEISKAFELPVSVDGCNEDLVLAVHVDEHKKEKITCIGNSFTSSIEPFPSALQGIHIRDSNTFIDLSEELEAKERIHFGDMKTPNTSAEKIPEEVFALSSASDIGNCIGVGNGGQTVSYVVHCPFCGQIGFKDKWYVDRHIQLMHSVSVKCSICEVVFIDKHCYVQHAKNCYYFCDIYGCSFYDRRKYRLEVHLRSKHRKNRNNK